MFYKDTDKTHTMHSKSNNIKIMIGNEADKIVNELFNSLFPIYQLGLEKSMKGTEYVFDSDDLLHYKCHKFKL